MNEQDVADTLDAAADHIRTRGLHNSGGWGAINEPDGPVCVLGAISMVRPDEEGTEEIWHEAIMAIGAVLNEKSPYATRLIAPWNDTPGRTAKEAITLLMEAAARIRSK